MRTFIHEIGVIDKHGAKHPVRFQKGLNVVTGKSSTGKSALIEIFDYCFGAGEYTVPKGVITDCAAIYYVAMNVNGQDIIIARNPEIGQKAYFRRVEKFESEEINTDYFESNYFRRLDDFKTHLRSFFLDIDDVDESLAARENRRHKAKSPTPSIRSFTSFILQHQNLVANKHALFYRFDQKKKRDQVIEHSKYFLGIVDQNYVLLSQEKERLTSDLIKLNRQQEANKKAADNYKERVAPVLGHLYAMMGFEEAPITIAQVLRNPEDAKDQLDRIITPEKINHVSEAVNERYNMLNQERTHKTTELRKLQRKASSISKHIDEEVRFVESTRRLEAPSHVHISATVCPFCRTEKSDLNESAEKLQQAILKVSGNLAQARPMKAKFESSLVETKREIEAVNREVFLLNSQITEIEKAEEKLNEQKSLYESILMIKARLFALLDTLNIADDAELDKNIGELTKELKKIDKQLEEYNTKDELENASVMVNEYMSEIGKYFDFEESYKPINLHFSFDTFDLYHQTPEGEHIYLRSMGSGANWLYSHVTLFLALHKYFAQLDGECAIPSILFFDQPTQVYFPNFNRDTAETFDKQKDDEKVQRKATERAVDEDIRAVENLFSQLSIYCNDLEEKFGFSPQIIVTDHADDLTLSNGVIFDDLVKENRWRKRGLIDPVSNF